MMSPSGTNVNKDLAIINGIILYTIKSGGANTGDKIITK